MQFLPYSQVTLSEVLRMHVHSPGWRMHSRSATEKLPLNLGLKTSANDIAGNGSPDNGRTKYVKVDEAQCRNDTGKHLRDIH